MLDISLVLYNSSAHLPALVESLLAQTVPLEKVALLVVDNDSSDDSAAKFEQLIEPHREKFRTVKFTASKQNLGFGVGHNTAIAQGAAAFVFLLNPDAELDRHCLATLLEMAQQDDKAAAWEARQAPYEHPKVYDPVTLETGWVSGAGVLLRRSVFEEIQGFDPHIFLYGEDVDLSWRIREKGWLLRYCPRAVLHHHTYSKPGEVKPMQFIGSIRANLYLRTRFGTWADIAIGVMRQLSQLRPSRKQIPMQQLVVLKGLWKWLKRFQHWRSGALRKIPQRFHGWDYAVQRQGAFHDITPGLGLATPPKVSVLIRTLGKQKLLNSALTTLANQTYPNIEVVIVEDGPATLESFLKSWKELLTITYAPLGENKGRCIAGNAAMEAASGEYFCFLDEDDLLYADHIEQLVASVLGAGAKVAYSYAFELPSEYGEKGNGILKEGELFWRFRGQRFSFLRLIRHNFIPIQSVLFHRSLYTQQGGFDPDIPYNEDWNLWVRYALAARPFALVPKTTSIYRVPMDNGKNHGRHAIMVEHQNRVRELQKPLKVETSIGELLAMMDAAPQEAVGLRAALIARYPFLRRPLELAARLRGKH